MEQDIFLIVDDNDELRQEMVSYLNRYGVVSVDVDSAKAAREVLLSQPISIVILDVVMPGESGLDLTKWIVQNLGTPVILLTSLDDVTDRVTGLEVGADDYIPKPFDQRELLARARSVLRRVTTDEADTAKTAPSPSLSLCTVTSRLTLPHGEQTKLKSQELKVLRFLSDNAGKVVTREMLYSHVYQRPWNPDDRAIDNIVVQLRKIIDCDDSTGDSRIKTVRNKGYFLDVGFIDCAQGTEMQAGQ
ncbi:MAG: response regulator transcription factor [Pseudomonadales bacterium]